MSPCTCPGFWEGQPNLCEHHKAGEPCPNRIRVSMGVVIDPQTREPIPGSDYGFCEQCGNNFHDKVVEPEFRRMEHEKRKGPGRAA
jgi:hypothetical protein